MDESSPAEIHPPNAATPACARLRQRHRDVPGGPNDAPSKRTAASADRGVIRSTPDAILQQPLGERDSRLPNVGTSHRQNWIDCSRSRRRPVADVEIGARSAQICQLGNIGYQLRQMLRWDPQREAFVDNVEANRLRSRENRVPWNRI